MRPSIHPPPRYLSPKSMPLQFFILGNGLPSAAGIQTKVKQISLHLDVRYMYKRYSQAQTDYLKACTAGMILHFCLFKIQLDHKHKNVCLSHCHLLISLLRCCQNKTRKPLSHSQDNSKSAEMLNDQSSKGLKPNVSLPPSFLPWKVVT